MALALRRLVAHAHGQRDALALQVDFQHLDLDDLAGLDDGVRVLDEGVGERRDVHQAVLMDADVDEGAEGGDVGDDAFEDHARAQVADLFDAVGEGRRLELGARVAAGFFQFLEDVLDGRQAEALVGVFRRVEALEGAAVAEDFLDRLLEVDNDFFDHRVGFRVHRRAVERVVAVRHAQEAGGLLEGLVAEARHFLQRVARAEGAVGVAVADDVGGQPGRQAGDAGRAAAPRRC